MSTKAEYLERIVAARKTLLEIAEDHRASLGKAAKKGAISESALDAADVEVLNCEIKLCKAEIALLEAR